jgi:acyl carrier protein
MTIDYNYALERICGHLERIAGNRVKITPDTNLLDQSALDSIKVLDLVMEIEDEFDVSVPLNLMTDVQTVREFADMLVRIKSGK